MINNLKGTVVNPDKIYGKSTYEIAVMHGYDGTEEEWIKSVEADRIATEKAKEAVDQDALAVARDKTETRYLMEQANEHANAARDCADDAARSYASTVQAANDATTAAELAESNATIVQNVLSQVGEFAGQAARAAADSREAANESQEDAENAQKAYDILKRSGRIVIGIEGVHTRDDADVLLGATWDSMLENRGLVQNALDDVGVNEVVFLAGTYYIHWDNDSPIYIREGKKLIGCGNETIFESTYDTVKESHFVLESYAEISNCKIYYQEGEYISVIRGECENEEDHYNLGNTIAVGTRAENVIVEGGGVGVSVKDVQIISNCHFITSTWVEITLDNAIVENNYFADATVSPSSIFLFNGTTRLINNIGNFVIAGTGESSLTVGSTTVPESKFKQLNEIGTEIECPMNGATWKPSKSLNSCLFSLHGNIVGFEFCSILSGWGGFSTPFYIEESEITQEPYVFHYDPEENVITLHGPSASVRNVIEEGPMLYAYKILNFN